MVTDHPKFQRLLDKTQKIFRVDIRYVLKGNLWLNLNRVASVINGLVLSVAFAHFLSKEAYGTYSFVLATLGIFSMPPSTGLGLGIIKSVARGNHRIIFEGMRKVLPWSLLAGGMLVALGAYYAFAGNQTLATCFILGGLVLPLSISNGAAKSFLTSKGDFETSARFNIWRTPIMTALLAATAYATSSALFVIVAHILGNVILGFLLYRSVKKMYGLDPVTSPDGEEGFNGKYAFHSGVISVFGYLSEKMDNLLLWLFMGAAPVALYSYATSPVHELKGLIENQSALALSKYAKKEFSDIKANIIFRIKQLYIFAIPAIVIYILAAPYLFKLLFPQYIDAVFFSQLAALSLLSTPRRLMNTAISAHQKIKESYIMNIAPNLIRIVLALIFIPKFGILGAIIALLASEVADYVILGLLIKSIRPANPQP